MKSGFEGRLIFLNHRYNVPGDVFGMVETATLVKREGRLDLDLSIVVESNNPLATQTYQMIANGTRLGVSVGVIVTAYEKTEEEDDFGRKIVDITGVLPLEASIVGIPANQTAWTQEAVKALFARGAVEFDEEEVGARPYLGDVVASKQLAATPFEELEVVGKGAVSGHSPAKAPQDRAWSGSQAVKRMRAWAGGPDKNSMNWTKYRTGFAWFNSDTTDSFGSYKMPHHDIINGKFVVVFKGVVAAAVVVQGGRGGVNIPEGDMAGVKSHLARHYAQFDEQAPWDREKSIGWLDAELSMAEELQIDLPPFDQKDTRVWVTTNDGEVIVEVTDAQEEKNAMATQTAETTRAANDAAVEIAPNADPKTADAETVVAPEVKDDTPEEKDAAAVAAEAASATPDATAAAANEAAGEDSEGDIDEGKKDDAAASATSLAPDTVEAAEAAAETAETKGEFDDAAKAAEAGDMVIDKLWTGFRVAANKLIEVLESDAGDGRRKAGEDIVAEYKDYLDTTWKEVMDFVESSDKAVSTDSFDLDAKLRKLAGVDPAYAALIEARVTEIAESSKTVADENKELRERARIAEAALALANQALGEIMELPLGAVTRQAAKVTSELAVMAPWLDTRVRERMAEYVTHRPENA
jgi:hypothetical protein